MQSYGELRQIDSGIWVRDGEWYGTTFRRRMTVMTNSLHGDDLGWMADQFPDALILVPAAILGKIKKKHRVTGSLENDWPAEWRKSIECLPVRGLRFIHESIFFHKASRSIILTDLVFNIQSRDFKNSYERKFMAWNRVGNGFGPSWLCNNLFTKDIEMRRQSISTLLTWDFDRVIMNHGLIIDADGKTVMRKAFGF